MAKLNYIEFIKLANKFNFDTLTLAAEIKLIAINEGLCRGCSYDFYHYGHDKKFITQIDFKDERNNVKIECDVKGITIKPIKSAF